MDLVLDAYEDHQNMPSLTDNMAVIRRTMQTRRELMYEQIRADDIKSQMCDRIADEKRQQDGLEQRIRALETTDPTMFEYIRKLEKINQGLWCTKCQRIKDGCVEDVSVTVVTTVNKTETSVGANIDDLLS
jgi:hypothetical protein